MAVFTSVVGGNDMDGHVFFCRGLQGRIHLISFVVHTHSIQHFFYRFASDGILGRSSIMPHLDWNGTDDFDRRSIFKVSMTNYIITVGFLKNNTGSSKAPLTVRALVERAIVCPST